MRYSVHTRHALVEILNYGIVGPCALLFATPCHTDVFCRDILQMSSDWGKLSNFKGKGIALIRS